RKAAGGDLLQQRPVAARAAGDLHDVEAHIHDPVDRCLVERRAHREQPLRAHPGEQLLELVPTEPRGKETWNVLVGAAAQMIDMYERVEIAELEFEGGANAVALDHIRATVDDRGPVLDRALVVVREIEHEQVTEIEAGDRLAHRMALLGTVPHALTN